MLLGFFTGFIVGITLASFFHISLFFIIGLVVVSGAIFFYKYFVGEEQHTLLFVSVCVLLGVLCGVGRMYVSDLYATSHLESFVGKKVSAVGVIVAEPDVRETNTKLTVRLDEVGNGIATTSVREKVLVSVPIYPEYHYGDKVSLQLTLEEPENIESDGRVFDYKGYLRVRGIWYTSRFATIHLVSSGHGAYIKTLLFTLKHKFTQALDNALPEPESSLMAGLLLGTKQSLGKDLLAEFQRTGTSHVVVLSGYNIAIVATSIMALLKFLPKNVSFSFGIVSIILFTILSGGGASAWRAAIMVLVALFAKKMNRDYKIGRVFAFTILLMLAPNPLLLVFDPSFQLSVLATIGIIFVSPLVAPYFVKVPERFGLREIVSSTVATQVVVLPYLIYNTGILSLVSLPVNILILGTIPITMLLGFITGVVGLISLWLSFIPALFAYVLLWYQLTVVHFGAILPFGAVMLPAFSQIVLYKITSAPVFGAL
jgi:competence protein ComEC